MPCSVHPKRERQPRPHAQPTSSVTPPVQQRDLHQLGWWIIEHVFAADDRAERDRFAIVVSVMRVLAGLGPESGEADAVAREVELRARLLHGLYPRDDDEWSLARSLFDDAALDLLRRLSDSDEADRGNCGHPLRGVEGTADEIELAGFGEDEQ